jgi:hypothetical protein
MFRRHTCAILREIKVPDEICLRYDMGAEDSNSVTSTDWTYDSQPVAYRMWGGGVLNSPPPKFRSFAKAKPNSQFRGI